MVSGFSLPVWIYLLDPISRVAVWLSTKSPNKHMAQYYCYSVDGASDILVQHLVSLSASCKHSEFFLVFNFLSLAILLGDKCMGLVKMMDGIK